ncbi:hypothetical protein COCMIDRAFT_85007 [Bipolaris oryzae ATCC 44560]|uniref:Integral membrane protein n=1 Tax=Bipolaris oryzae ATCC 44560 TaxID=930090 RepID=W6ZP36_COCMI|nr:uncharacterized protein COCMIDRAFT_85007 [Bipolaris oryzae ATCC 44560]EUC49274.1 hypothetical protein COCMIDRAFT_85007 [Bipolaris oryzae ATCC 44560]
MNSQIPHNPKRNKTFHPSHIPIKPNATLHPVPTHITGPLPFLNPTKAHYHIPSHPDIRFKWTSRNDRKGRHAISINHTSNSANGTTPRPTTSLHTILRNIWKMATYYPVWDLSFCVAYVFTIGSVLWILNAFFVFLPLVQPQTELEGEELYGGGIAAFIGATVFEVGSVLLLVEAVNEGRSGCFGWAVERAFEGEEEEIGVRLEKGGCGHAHKRGEGEGDEKGERRKWVWWPAREELQRHYIHNLGFLASLAQFVGATIFWVAGFTALPGIYDNMSKTVTIVFYWTPQVVGGLGFIISGLLFMIETQRKWWKPAPRVLGWWIGALNLIGGVGFTLCPAFGYDNSSWAQYQACLSTFWGSWAFMIGSTLQWYESLEKFPVEVNKSVR